MHVGVWHLPSDHTISVFSLDCYGFQCEEEKGEKERLPGERSKCRLAQRLTCDRKLS